MIDLNKAHSNSANASKRLKKKETTKKITKAALISCEGKISFNTFKAAAEVAGKKRKEVKIKRKAYCCFYCHQYHIG
jgi:hypothetical protein